MEREIVERSHGRRRVMQRTIGDSLTEQAHANEVDINSIVSRYTRTGMLPSRGGSPAYGDFSGVVDYQTCLDAVASAQAEFMKLPAQVRKEFDNDPGKLLAFLQDEDNRDEAIRLGLIENVPPVEAAAPPEAPESPVEPTS